MSVTSAIPFLRDFGSTSGGNLEGSDVASSQLNTVGVGATEFAQQEYERGLEEGRAQAEDAFNSELRAFKEQAAADLEEARTAWVSNEGAELRRQVEVGFEDLYRDLSDAASVALKPVLEAHVLARTLAHFSECLQEMASGSSVRMKLAGSEDLVSAIKEQLQGSFDNIEVSVKDVPELSLRVEDTTISTNLTKWAQAIEEIAS